MADKKVDRFRPGRSLTPTRKLTSAISDPGTINMAEPDNDKGKSTLLDKFRKREERWRLEQTLHDQEAGRPTGSRSPADSHEEGSEGRESRTGDGDQ